MRPRVKPVDPEKAKEHDVRVRPHTADPGVLVVECTCADALYRTIGERGVTTSIEALNKLVAEHLRKVCR